jgi:hypothetical protein
VGFRTGLIQQLRITKHCSFLPLTFTASKFGGTLGELSPPLPKLDLNKK